MKNDDEIERALETVSQISGRDVRAKNVAALLTTDLEQESAGALIHTLCHLNIVMALVPSQARSSPQEAETIARMYGASSVMELMQKASARCREIQEELTFRIDGAPCGEPDCPHCGDGLGDDGPPSA